MPWSTSDASVHNKKVRNDPKLAELWAKVANETRERSLSHGETESIADGRAIREANAVVSRRLNYYD